MVIPWRRVHAIVWCLFRAVHSVRFCTPAVVIDVTAADGAEIPMTTLSHLGGGQFKRALWLQTVSQWAGLLASPMRVPWHTVMSFWSGGMLCMCPVYTWWNLLKTAPVTASLLFVLFVALPN